MTVTTAFLATAFAVSIATAIAIATATTAATTAFACELTDELLDFIVGGRTVLHDRALEVQLLAGKGMVQVNHHHLVANVNDAGHEAIAFLVLQGDNGIDEDSLAIEATVDSEKVAV